MTEKQSRFFEKIFSNLLIGASLLWVLWLVFPTLNSGFLAGWDSRGHLFKAYYWAHSLFKNGFWEGWFPSWHGGFPLNYVYPPLFTFIMGIPTLIFDKNLVLNLTSAFLFMSFVPAMYTFLRSFGLGRVPAALGSSLILLIDPPFTAGITPIYKVGLLPNSWGFILTILLLARVNRDLENLKRPQKSIILTGFLFATLILSHAFSTYWFFMACFFLAIGTYYYDREQKTRIFSRLLIIFTVGLGLSIFWWLPFILNFSNMNKVEPMPVYFPLETLGRLGGLLEAGGLPMHFLALAGVATLWLKKERKNLFFLGWIIFITFHIALNTFNTSLPFAAVLSSPQKIRFEGFYLWAVVVLAAFSLGGLELLIRRYKWSYFLSMSVAAVLIHGLILSPSLIHMKGVPKIINNLNIRILPEMARFLANKIKPGEFILSEFNWEAQRDFGSPHFLNQNLPLFSNNIWDLQGNLPESTKGAEKAKIMSQQMTNPIYFPNNIDYLHQRGVRYLVTTQKKTRELFLNHPEKYRLVWDSRNLFHARADKVGSAIDTPTIFELNKFQRPLGLSTSVANALVDLKYSPPGKFILNFEPPVELEPLSTFALSFHPWLKIAADDRPITTTKNDDFLLAIEGGIHQAKKIEIQFSPPVIVFSATVFSGLFLLFLLFILIRSQALVKIEKLLIFSRIQLKKSMEFLNQKPPTVIDIEPSLKTRKILLIILIILFSIFFFSRFYDLAARPMHNDEGVNSFFLINLVKSNNYRYDPQNYHGPSLYYLQLIPTWLTTLKNQGLSKFSWSSPDGVTETSVRVLVAFAGLLVLLGLLAARNRIGTWGAVTAFILAGISPDFLFYSRYFIHEILVVLFMFGTYIGATYFIDTKKFRYFYLSCFSGVMLFCTKETSLIYFLCFTGAYDLSRVIGYFSSEKKEGNFTAELISRVINLRRTLGGHLYGGLALILTVWFLLFSSFFTNLKGLGDSIIAYAFWSGTGIESGHNKPFWYFIKEILLVYESPAVLLSLVGMWFAFRLKDKKGLFLSFWAMGIVGAHSFIPYKTPWLAINFLLPMFLLSGYAIQQLINAGFSGMVSSKFSKIFYGIVGVISILLVIQIRQSVKIVYKEYDNEKHKQVYVHTHRDVYRLANDIDDITAGLPDGKEVQINIYSTVQWPLPFYLRKYKRTAWWGENVSPMDAPIIIAQKSQQESINKTIKNKYKTTKYFLRKGVDLVVYIDEEFFKNKRKQLSEAVHAK